MPQPRFFRVTRESPPKFVLTLYVKSNCVFCSMVIHALEELDLPYDERNIADKGILEELMARGGKKQTPYLADTDAKEELYGSAEIVGYLMTHFGGAES